MTTKNVVVADGSKEGKGEKSPAEIRGLVQVKANELVERIGKSLELGVVLDGMQRLIEGLDIAEEMVYTPLEWSDDIGGFREQTDMLAAVNVHSVGDWRLPTEKELDRALRAMKPKGFLVSVYYWTSTPHFDGRGLTLVENHGQGLGAISHHDLIGYMVDPRVRLCRPKALD